MTKTVSHHRGRPRKFDREHALKLALKLFWEKGYEPVSVAELCSLMEIQPPSLYAAFGSKAELFLEALEYYERTYWEAPAKRFMKEPDIYRAIARFFDEAASILLSPDTPCGCMVVLAAVNISPKEADIIEAVRGCRLETRLMFAERLRRAIKDGQLPADTNVAALAGALNTFLEGLSLQAKDWLLQNGLQAMGSLAVRLLPPKNIG